MPSLIIRYPGGTDRSIDLGATPLTLGRSEMCDIILPCEDVSRTHARISTDETGQVVVEDCGSKNGTRVDHGDPFRGGVRFAGRMIRIGDFDIQVVGATSPEASDAVVRFQPDEAVDGAQTCFFPSTRGFDLNQQRLGLLMGLTERIGGAFDRKQMLEQALDACCEALQFERGLIALKTQRGETDMPTTRNVQRDESGAYTVSRTLINRALIHGERAVVNNPALDLAGNMSESLVRFPIRSALCVPIMHRDEIMGVVYGDRITQAATYTESDVDFLAAIAQQVGTGLSNLRLFRSHLEAQRVLHELERARVIQQELVPSEPLCAGRVALSGFMEPSSAVGGDYFDYFELGNGRLGFIIADVTGHGLAAALVMANLKGAVRVALTANVPLPELGARLNRQVCDMTDSGVFITAIVGRICLASGAIEYFNAGHPPPVLIGNTTVELMGISGSLPLGVEANEEFVIQHINSDKNLEGVLFYTDGLTEAEDEGGQMLDVDPVVDALAGTDKRTTDALLDTTLSVVQRHVGRGKPADDLTLMALQFQQS